MGRQGCKFVLRRVKRQTRQCGELLAEQNIETLRRVESRSDGGTALGNGIDYLQAALYPVSRLFNLRGPRSNLITDAQWDGVLQVGPAHF
jgi:hypothetical protein